MAYIEPMIRRKFSQPDRIAVQDKACLAVEADPDRFLAAYRLDSRSFQERYVNSDLMKEMFPEYSASKEHRSLQFTGPQCCRILGRRAVPSSLCR
jgi:hypothetical protein